METNSELTQVFELIAKDMQIKTMKYYFIPTRMAIKKNRK